MAIKFARQKYYSRSRKRYHEIIKKINGVRHHFDDKKKQLWNYIN